MQTYKARSEMKQLFGLQDSLVLFLNFAELLDAVLQDFDFLRNSKTWVQNRVARKSWIEINFIN